MGGGGVGGGGRGKGGKAGRFRDSWLMSFGGRERGGWGGKHHVGGVEDNGCGGWSGCRGHEQARKERWELLVAECARDDVMFAKVRMDGGVLGEEAFLKMQRDRVC